MKIAILTLPLRENYGGILQTYALQTVLTRMGHDVTLLDHFETAQLPPVWKRPLAYAKRSVEKYLLGKDLRVFKEQYERRIRNELMQNLNEFADKYLNNMVCRHYRDFRKDWDYDLVVVGSDQVWRKEYLPEKIENMFLDFVSDIPMRRIAYAASFGVDKLDFHKKEIARCKKLLEKFEAVSVREDSGVAICKDVFGKDVVRVLDPMLLLRREDYDKLVAAKNPPKSSGNMMVSILDMTPERTEQVGKIAKQLGKTPFRAVQNWFYMDAPVEERIVPPLEQWLRGFMDADIIVTDSFHACVFSIIFHKPFIALGNKARGMSRFVSLLSLFGLEDRLVSNIEDFDFNAPIDWKEVDDRHERLRAESLAFLQEHLHA